MEKFSFLEGPQGSRKGSPLCIHFAQPVGAALSGPLKAHLCLITSPLMVRTPSCAQAVPPFWSPAPRRSCSRLRARSFQRVEAVPIQKYRLGKELVRNICRPQGVSQTAWHTARDAV